METFDNYKQLASTIILNAVNDYKRSFLHGNERGMRDGERFFSSDWFELLAAYCEELESFIDSENKIIPFLQMRALLDERERKLSNGLNENDEEIILINNMIDNLSMSV